MAMGKRAHLFDSAHNYRANFIGIIEIKPLHWRAFSGPRRACIRGGDASFDAASVSAGRLLMMAHGMSATCRGLVTLCLPITCLCRRPRNYILSLMQHLLLIKIDCRFGQHVLMMLSFLFMAYADARARLISSAALLASRPATIEAFMLYIMRYERRRIFQRERGDGAEGESGVYLPLSPEDGR